MHRSPLARMTLVLALVAGPAVRAHGDGGALDAGLHLPLVLQAAAGPAAGAPGGPSPAGGTPPRYAFFPLGGTVGQDVFAGSFVDLDPDPLEIQDFDCGVHTRDGHAGVDAGVPSFAEQRIGVPVFAVEDGVVVFAQDGFDDENVAGGVGGNIVAIEHAGGRVSSYYHLRKNSVSVALNDVVAAGRQIGLLGSSGNSFGPHLHFQTEDAGIVVEPYAGPCRPGPSEWVTQPPNVQQTFVWDFGITTRDMYSAPASEWFPFPPPRDGSIPTNGVDWRPIFYWLQLGNLPAGAVISERFVQPDGNEATGIGFTFPLGGPAFQIESHSWFPRWIPPLSGTWRLQISIDGVPLLDAPFDVVLDTLPAPPNRPPVLNGIALDPPSPRPEDVIFCRVSSPRPLEDLDWDVVRYRFEWRMNGTLVRAITSAGLADAIPRGTAAAHDVVQCSVVPGDGSADGTGASVSASVGCAAGTDGDGDGVCNAEDDCVTVANPDQADTGGVGTGSGPDGIGDACQCGDVNDDGRVTNADAVLVARSLLVPPRAVLPRPDRCDVGGSAGCTNADVVILRRALLLPATATIAPRCVPAP